MKYVPPSVRETAFNCPHCGALAKQYWSSLHANHNSEKQPLPILIDPDDQNDFKEVQDPQTRARMINLFERLKEKRPLLSSEETTLYGDKVLYNVSLSRCFNCKDIAIWIADKLTYPVKGEALPPNPDLPDDIKRDYLEASSILHLSPRGSAALIRLCIQKLCKYLEQPGKDINKDIGALVAKGLDARVQRALDAVRVIGNNAVHPGKIDITDDRAIAESLFGLLNVIAEKMISEPKHVDAIYAGLPPAVLKQIEERDKGSN